MAAKLPSDEIQRLLKSVVDHFDAEDRMVRERQIRLWKKLKYYWEGFTRVWWSETAHDWRIYDENYNVDNYDAALYDKPVNVFRAYLESIIAALSVSIPSIVCLPDNAESAEDLDTAKAGDKIAELIHRHNDIELLWLHALYIYCTEGLVACYHYSHSDEKYGTAEIPKYEETDVEDTTNSCPNCGTSIKEDYCPTCMETVVPEVQTNIIKELQMVGKTNEPKSRQCLEVYGGLFVKTPVYAMRQEDCPYLIFAYETHYANVIERYEHLRDKFTNWPKVGPSGSGMYDSYERWGRLSTQYFGDYPVNNVTCRNAWLRPCSFNVLSKDQTDLLKKEYPKGARVVFVNDNFAEASEAELDKEWTLSYNPLADYLQHDPLGLVLVSIQDITNDLMSLVLQTIEHGIPQTFVDPTVVNFNQYAQVEAKPGTLFPAKAPVGKNMGDAFYEIKTATLSNEIEPFMQRVQEAGQLVSGALPSLFGGAAPNSSKTAAQYAMSRAQALQRLQTPWKILCYWYKNIMGKTIPAFIEHMIDDERYVAKQHDGGFLNVFIRKTELLGKIGSVELEASEQLPITWAQRKDSLVQFLQQIPDAIQYLASPENLPLLAKSLGIPEFVMPGEDDRTKQYEEIQLLINSEPTTDIDQLTGEQIELPSVQINPDVDNHMIEGEICRQWLVSLSGREASKNNPLGYRNVLLHFQAHKMALMASMPQQQEVNNGSRQSDSSNQQQQQS